MNQIVFWLKVYLFGVALLVIYNGLLRLIGNRTTVYEYYLNQEIPIKKRFLRFFLHTLLVFAMALAVFFVGRLLGMNPITEWNW
jgi:hypothetical protein